MDIIAEEYNKMRRRIQKRSVRCAALLHAGIITMIACGIVYMIAYLINSRLMGYIGIEEDLTGIIHAIACGIVFVIDYLIY